MTKSTIRKALLAISTIGLVAAAAINANAQNIRTELLSCSNFAWLESSTTCSINRGLSQVLSIQLISERSNNKCFRNGQQFFASQNSLTVLNGCRATFQVVYQDLNFIPVPQPIPVPVPVPVPQPIPQPLPGQNGLCTIITNGDGSFLVVDRFGRAVGEATQSMARATEIKINAENAGRCL